MPPEPRQEDSLPRLRERRKAKATMGIGPHSGGSRQPQERQAADRRGTADPAEQSKTMTILRRGSRLPGQPRQRDAGPLEPLIGSFALHLAAEGKAARTVQGYNSAVRWFAVGYLAGQAGKTSWEQVDAQDIQRWITQLLDLSVPKTCASWADALRRRRCGHASGAWRAGLVRAGVG